MKSCFILLFLMLSGCVRHVGYIETNVRRDAESYAIAACLADQENTYLKEQGDAWASGVVQLSQLTIDAMTGISEAVSQEIAKGDMAVGYSRLGDERDTKMPVFYCFEMTEKPLVRVAIENAVSATERWLKFRK